MSAGRQPPRALRFLASWQLVAGVTIGLGVGSAALLHPWTRDLLDGRRVLEAGATWAAGGDPYAVRGYFYTPALAVVASLLPAWSLYVLLVASMATVLALAPRHPLAIVAILAWPPVWADLALGNETILLTGALMLAIGRDDAWRGAPLGIGLALVPKPMFLPVLLWLLVHRRRSLLGIVLAGLAVTVPAALATGAYPAFFGALAVGIEPKFEGNIGITTVLPDAGLLVSILALVVAAWWARRDEAGLMVAAIAGTFMGTYVGLYAPVLPAGALARFAARYPGRGLAIGWLGAVGWLALPVAGFVAFLAAVVRRFQPSWWRRAPEAGSRRT